MNIRGIIFDFNGVLVDDEPLHFKAFQRVLEKKGLKLNWKEYYENYLAYDDKNFFLNYFQDQNQSLEPEIIASLTKSKSQEYFSMVGEKPPIINSSINFLNQLPPQIFLAIASGAAQQEIDLILTQIGILQRFSTIIAAEDVINGKPHPEGFQKALSGLQNHQPDLDASEVVGVEDSYRGIPSVKAAGMKCIAIATTYSADRLCEADLIIESFAGWTIDRLEMALTKP